MSDVTQNQQTSPDILGQLNNDAMNRNTDEVEKNTQWLIQLHKDLDNLMRSGGNYSQGNMRDRMFETRSNYTSSIGNSSTFGRNRSKYNAEIRDLDDALTEMLKGIGEGLRDSFNQDDVYKQIKKDIHDDLENIAKELGCTLEDVPRELGKQLSRELLRNAPKNQRITDNLANATQAYYNQFARFADRLRNTNFGARFANIIPDYAALGNQMSDAIRDSQGDFMQAAQDIRRNTADIIRQGVSGLNVQNGTGASGAPDLTQGEAQHHDTEGAQNISTAVSPNLKDSTYFRLIELHTSSIDKSVNTIIQMLGSSLGGGASQFEDLLNEHDESFNRSQGEAQSIFDNQEVQGLLGPLRDQAQSIIGQGATDLINGAGLAEAGEGVITGFASLGESALALAPELIAIIGPLLAINAAMAAVQAVINAFKWALAPATDAIHEFTETLAETSDRAMGQWKDQIENETKRLQEDVRTMVTAPFEIMSKAAEEWYNTWDSNLKTISQTQGYTKSDLQNLMASYAERLRQEGLTSVVSASDITNNLAQVLSSGLSGELAEAFAYQATLLNNAIPTQNFFDYASTYASVAANAKLQGASMSDAINQANKQLTQFASNVLYASRELSGGFSTGLQNASDIFANSVRIANSAGIGDSSYISGVLTSVASAVGAVAPDLASSLVDVVTNTALGGNSSEYTALRSLAGTGAANTAFLKAFANDPQKVFSTLFTNLAHMQKMSADNFMEVAEGLSQTFGVSMDAFARVDFSYLADVIKNMKVDFSAVSENLGMLASGQSTTSQEQMKMAEINSMILNEGLAYVLDNEAARLIQQHMWDQELANEIKAAEYAVNLRGESLNLIQGISETVERIQDLINPIGWAVSTIGNLVATSVEYSAQRSDIRQLLELGKVGVGNLASLHKLTTTNVALLQRETSLIERMGGISAYGMASSATNIFNTLTSRAGIDKFMRRDTLGSLITALTSGAQMARAGSSGVNSLYSWNVVGKSLNNAITATPMSSNTYSPISSRTGSTVTAYTGTQEQINANKLQQFLNSMESAAQVDMANPDKVTTYEEWRASASKYGIKNLDETLQTNGISEAQLRGTYESYQAQAASKYEWDREATEDKFWMQSMEFYETMKTYMDDLITNVLRKEWLTDAWQTNWLDTAWQTNWLDTAWKTDWIENAWKSSWLTSAWSTDWLENAWKTDWLTDAWNKSWLETAWNQDWLTDAWNKGWVTDTWNKQWIENTWNKWAGDPGSRSWSKFFEDWQVQNSSGAYLNSIFGGKTTYASLFGKNPDNTGINALNKSLSQVKNAEGSDLALQLANTLVKSSESLKTALADPTVQTNVLLSQILIVLTQLMEAENSAGGATLATSLSGLALLKS